MRMQRTMLVQLLLCGLAFVRAQEEDIGTCPHTTVMGLCERLHRTTGKLTKQIGDLLGEDSNRRTILQERRIEDLEKRLLAQEESMQWILDEAGEEDQPLERPQASAGGDEKTVSWNMVKSLMLKVEELRTRTTELEKELLEEQEKRQQLQVLVEDTRSEGRRLREDVSSQRVEPLVVSAVKNAVNKTEILLLGNKTEHLDKRLQAVEKNTKCCDRIATIEKELPKITDNFVVKSEVRNCGVSPPGSEKTSPYYSSSVAEAWPFLVGLHDPTVKNGGLCYGFMIDRKHLITAQNCLPGLRYNREDVLKFHAFVNTVSKFYSPSQVYNISDYQLLSHVKKGEEFDFDFGLTLVTLRESVRQSNFSAVCLPGPEHRELEGKFGTLLAMTNFKREGNVKPEATQFNHIRILSSEQCSADGASVEPQKMEDVLCIKDPRDDGTCWSGLGPPLVIKENGRWYAVAVSTRGYGCKEIEKFPRLSSYVRKINRLIESS